MSGTHRVERIVVGGGIGGLTTALALARNGLDCTVLERQDEFMEIGAGIQLAPNALRVLDRLGVLHDVLTNAVRPSQAQLINAVSGAQITALDFGASFRERYGYPYIVTHRSDLLNAILDGCRANDRISLETSMAVADLTTSTTGARVVCENGVEWETQALIGADGLWSAVRQYTLGDGEPSYVGHVAYRGTVPIEVAPEILGHDRVTWWIGPGMHLIQYPVRRGELLNQVAVFEADTSGNPDDWGPPDELEQFFEGKVDHVRNGAALLNTDRRWVLRDRPPVANWTTGRVTLLGDAAHPMVQYLAQGACQALEDALVLADCLAATPDDVGGAFARYQAIRIPRTASTQVGGRTMGEIVHASGVTALLRDELLKDHQHNDFRYVDWLYGYDPLSSSSVLSSAAAGAKTGAI